MKQLDQIWTVNELKHFRASVIEECALAVEEQNFGDGFSNEEIVAATVRIASAAAIRRLKERT